MSTGPISVDTPDTPGTPNNGAEAVGSIDVLDASRRRRFTQRQMRWILPFAVLGAGMLFSALLHYTSPTPVEKEPVDVVPLVRVQAAVAKAVRLNVTAHGVVTPRTESDVVAEVRGRIVSVSPSLVAGGFFAEGDELLRLDDREARIAVAQVRLRSSESRLAAAEAARRHKLSRQGAVSASDLEGFESRSHVASASLAEARAQLAQAELDLERTVMRAPFEGRVRERQVDVGQFVSPGATLGRIYAVDYAEVRLPIATQDLVHFDLGLGAAGGWAPQEVPVEGAAPTGARVTLRASFGGQTLEWPARLVRTEGEIDLKTRTLHVVARVDDPYGRKGPVVAPLPAGLFVEAQIEGREIDGLFTVPAMAIRDGDTVYVVDSEDRLRVRDVELLRRGRDEAVIGEGISAGDRLVISPLRAVSDGMRLRVAGDAKADAKFDAGRASAEADAS
jgi:multidrug efflux system membrane fusion protein